MNCYKHEYLSGVNTCCKCGEWLCEECSISIDNRIICKECINKLVNFYDNIDSKKTVINEVLPQTSSKKPNPKVAALLGLFPGAGLMYLGLFQQGLFASLSLFTILFLTAEEEIIFLAILLPILYVTSIMYSYKSAQKILNGEYIEDSFSAILKLLRKYLVVILALIIIGILFGMGLNGLEYLFEHMSFGYRFRLKHQYYVLFSLLIPIAKLTIVSILGYVIFKEIKNNNKNQ